MMAAIKYLICFLIIIVIGFIKCFYIPTSTLYYEENKEEIINPGRGFYVQINSYEPNRLRDLKDENIKVVLIAFDIEDYLNTFISKEKLRELELILNEVKKYDMMVVFRAAYGFDPKYEDPKSIENIFTHIKQIAPIINENKDVILSVQAGFIGPWGEWHNSKFLSGDDKEIIVRNNMIRVLLENLDNNIILNVRRPRFIRDAFNNGIDISRLGIHNDALLSSKNDLGTYDDINYSREEELHWAKEYLSHGVNGGEMPILSEFSSINNAVEEMKSLQITYLNKRYNREIMNEWKTQQYDNQNAYQYIKNHLGYRLWISRINISTYIKSNRRFSVNVTINNSGFAPISRNYNLSLVMKKGNEVILKSKVKGEISTIYNDMKKGLSVNINTNDFTNNDYNEDIFVGLYIADKENKNHIELANKNMIFIDGINFFARFKYEDNKYVLDH